MILAVWTNLTAFRVIDLQKAWSDGSVVINMEPYPILGTEMVGLGDFLASEGPFTEHLYIVRNCW